jgi:hypothetical protein
MRKLFTFAMIAVFLLSACGAPATEVPAPTPAPSLAPTLAPTATLVPTPTSTPDLGILGKPGTWTVMMYQDADDEVLEEDIFFDVNEAELVGSTDKVTIVAQLDRYEGGFDGDGDMTHTKRYLVTQDDDLSAINSQVLDDLGEADMGDPQTLYDFATWAMLNYPAEHYVLIMSDHGAGWMGGWSDHDSGNGLNLQEIDNALGAIIADTVEETGVNVFELVGFDACLMGQLEVMSAIAPHARYAVGSEETEPSLGWAYAGFLSALTENTEMSGAELGQIIVDGYIAQDTRIVDDQARLVFMGDNYSMESVVDYLSSGVTLTAVDLGAMQGLNAAVNELAVALINADQEAVAQARAYAQSYTSVWWDGIPPSYIDLGHFADLLIEGTDDAAVKQSAENVKAALSQSVVAEKHGKERPGSTGLTIFFPNSELYEVSYLMPGQIEQYTDSAGRFAAASLWDDFLTYHYAGESFDPAIADLAVLTPAESMQTDFVQAAEESAPEENAEIVAPSSVEIGIDPLTVSAAEIGPDGVVTLSTEITGSNIAYVYYYVSYWSEEYQSYLTADMGYLNSDEILEIGGVFYPDWGSNGVEVAFDWSPTIYYMSDGNEANDQFAFFEPTVYGTEFDTFSVRGTYTFLNSGNSMDAKIDFSNGEMQSVWGFTGDDDSSGAWREIRPKPGDTFTITDEWLEFEKNPDGEFVDYDGGVMTFGESPFIVSEYYAFTGSYTLAIGVEDFDGNTIWEFTEVTVTE